MRKFDFDTSGNLFLNSLPSTAGNKAFSVMLAEEPAGRQVYPHRHIAIQLPSKLNEHNRTLEYNLGILSLVTDTARLKSHGLSAQQKARRLCLMQFRNPHSKVDANNPHNVASDPIKILFVDYF